MIKRIVDRWQWIVMGLLAICLPFTSFPLVSRLIRSSMVAPLSILPVGALVLFWLIPYLLRSGRLHPQTRPLLAFIMAAAVSAAAAFFLPFPAFKSASLVGTELKALSTLAVGVCFYFVLATWPDRSERICFLLRWINWSGVIVLGWSLFQVAVWYPHQTYPDWMWTFQGMMVSSLRLYGQRSNGFAYEPSWLAHQLNMLYLPFWLAATVSGFTAHRFRLWKIHFENLLLVVGIVVLVLSISRIGLLTFLLTVAFMLLLWNIRLVRWLQNRLTQHSTGTERQVRAVRRWVAFGSVLVLLVVYAGLLFGAAYGMSRYDARLSRMFDLTAWKEQNFMYYANQLVFAERVVFWQAGWEVFNDHPILGVGLGNAGLLFAQKLSSFSWALTEVRTLMYQSTVVPNIKSLWVRLLAETGIVGFGLFASWCYLLWQSAGYLRAQKDGMLKMVGLAGSFVLIGFVIEGFSLDTFALPYYWISFGLLTAACELARRFQFLAAAGKPASAASEGSLLSE